jgi:hypothetical protein
MRKILLILDRGEVFPTGDAVTRAHLDPARP